MFLFIFVIIIILFILFMVFLSFWVTFIFTGKCRKKFVLEFIYLIFINDLVKEVCFNIRLIIIIIIIIDLGFLTILSSSRKENKTETP